MDVLGALLQISIYSSVIFAVIMLLKKILGSRMSPALHYGIWAILVIRLMLPFTIHTGVSLITVPETQASQSPTVTAQVTPAVYAGAISQAVEADFAAIPSGGRVSPSGAQGVDTAQEVQSPAVPGILPGLNPGGIVLALWLAGVIAGIAFMARGYILLARRIARDTVPVGGRILRLFHRCRRELGIGENIRVVVLDALATPALFVRSTVLIPGSACAALDDRDMEYVLRHELMHYRRGDHLVHMLLCLLQALYWFNPLVWLAFRQIRADMETACDSVVAASMDRDEKSRYAGLILSQFAKPAAGRMVLGLAQGGTRKDAEKRIRGIFAKGRSRMSAKCLSLVTALILLVSCFTTACQPTPDDPTVVGKNDGEMERIIASTPLPQDTLRPTSVPAPTPVHYADSFPAAEDTVTVHIDADVSAPSGAVPVVKVTPHFIDMDEIRAMAAELFQGNTAYEPRVGMSRQELEEEILKIQHILEDEAAMLENYGDQDTVDEVKAMYRQRIADYQAQYADAPETLEVRESDWTFHPEAYYKDMTVYGKGWDLNDAQGLEMQQKYYESQTIRLDSKVSDCFARMEVMNLDTDNNVSHSLTFLMGSELSNLGTPVWNYCDARPMAMTPEEAAAMVSDALARMGLEGMRLSACESYGKLDIFPTSPGGMDSDSAIAHNLAIAAGGGVDPADAGQDDGKIYQYHLSYVPAYEGVAVCDPDRFIYERNADAYAPDYPYEQISVVVRNDMITEFYWTSPMDGAGVENQNVATLSPEGAIEAFRRQMQVQYTLASFVDVSDDDPDYEQILARMESADIRITDIQMNLMRVRIQNDPGGYRMIPVWVFSGRDEVTFRDQGRNTPPDAEQPEAPMHTYAVINALDGSVINTTQGY